MGAGRLRDNSSYSWCWVVLYPGDFGHVLSILLVLASLHSNYYRTIDAGKIRENIMIFHIFGGIILLGWCLCFIWLWVFFCQNEYELCQTKEIFLRTINRHMILFVCLLFVLGPLLLIRFICDKEDIRIKKWYFLPWCSNAELMLYKLIDSKEE